MLLVADTFAGSGSVLAEGGDARGGSGGGGRLSVEYKTSTFSGTLSVDGGVNATSGAFSGQTGSLFRCQSSDPGASSIGVGGLGLASEFGTAGGVDSGVQVQRTILEWRDQRMEWADTSTDMGGAQLNNTVDYTVNGLGGSTEYLVFTNAVQMGSGSHTSDPSGVLVISNIVLLATHTTLVRTATVGPTIVNQTPTNLAATSGFMNGFLSSTGNRPTTVSVYWGSSDGGNPSSGLWRETNTWAQGFWAANSYPTYHATGLTENVFYYYRYYAENAGGTDAGNPSEFFLAGTVWVTAPDFDADEDGQDPGIFTIQRDPGATNEAVSITFRYDGTADTNDYTLSPDSTNVTLPKGIAATNITLTPVEETEVEGAETVVLVLETVWPATIGSPASNTVTIADKQIPRGTNVTVAAGNWTNSAVWSLARSPLSGDRVEIRHDLTMPAGRYPVFDTYVAFSVSNGVTVTCEGDPAEVNPASGGSNPEPHGIGVSIYCTNAVISGTLDADGQGFPSRDGPGYPGGSRLGGCHGGRGTGNGGPLVTTAGAYGLVDEPTALGSGGYGGDSGICPGGGAIAIHASDALVLNGTLTAQGTGGTRGTGAGGSIWLETATLSGSGAINARGGDNGDYGVGGGGRVSLQYSLSTFTGSVELRGGRTATYSGQPGTLWEPQHFDGLVGSAGNPVIVAVTNSYQYHFADSSTNRYWDLAVSGAWFEPHDGSMQIDNLVLTNGTLWYSDVAHLNDHLLDMTNFTIVGSIDMTGASQLGLIDSVLTLTGDLSVASAATLWAQGNPTAVNADSGGTGGVPHGAGPRINCLNATIDGTIDGDLRGFPSRQGPGGGTSGQRGGTYGGRGKISPASSYGSLVMPTALGSGGYDEGSFDRGPGGSAVMIAATNTLTLDGTITLGSAGGAGSQLAGGSGGSVVLLCDTFAGGGAIQAIGGHGSGGDGGGGRVSTACANSSFTGTVSVLPGGPTAQTGTVFECESACPGASYGIGCGGLTLESDFAVSGDQPLGVRIARTVTTWNSQLMLWTDTSTDMQGTQLDNTADYTVSGLRPDQKYVVNTNSVALAVSPVVVGALGDLTVTNISLNAALTMEIRPLPRGTLLLVR